MTCRVDSFISKYEDVLKISSAYARLFTQKSKSDKFILNLTDGHNTINIGGFNISNFKMRYLNEFIGDIIQDYE